MPVDGERGSTRLLTRLCLMLVSGFTGAATLLPVDPMMFI